MESLREYSERHVLSTRGWTEWRDTGHSSSSEWMGQQSRRVWEDSSRLTGHWSLDFSKVGQFISPTDTECTQVHLKSIIHFVLKMDAVIGNLLEKHLLSLSMHTNSVTLILTISTINCCKIFILVCQLWSLNRIVFCKKPKLICLASWLAIFITNILGFACTLGIL